MQNSVWLYSLGHTPAVKKLKRLSTEDCGPLTLVAEVKASTVPVGCASQTIWAYIILDRTEWCYLLCHIYLLLRTIQLDTHKDLCTLLSQNNFNQCSAQSLSANESHKVAFLLAPNYCPARRMAISEMCLFELQKRWKQISITVTEKKMLK